MVVEDASGKIQVQLWESQVGLVLFGKTYKLTQLSTRKFHIELFATTTRQSTIEEVICRSNYCEVKEDPVISVCAVVTRVEVAVSRTCRNCSQKEFESKGKYQRCMKCKMLQKTGMYKPSAIANVTVFGELNVSINNSMLHRYFINSDLSHLLQDEQDMEEHLLECGSLKMHFQNDNVVAMVKISKETPSEESSSESSMSVSGEVQSVCATVEAEAMSVTGEAEAMPATGEAEFECVLFGARAPNDFNLALNVLSLSPRNVARSSEDI